VPVQIATSVKSFWKCFTEPSKAICVEWITAWLLATLIVGALVVAGEQVLAVGEQLGWHDFLVGGEYTPTTPPLDCVIHTNDRAEATRECWTPGQKRFLVVLVILDTIWAVFLYMPLLILLTLRLLNQLSNDGLTWTKHLAAKLLLAFALPLVMLFVDLAENLLAILSFHAADETSSLWWLALATKVKTRTMFVAITVPMLLFGMWFFGLSTSVGANRERSKMHAALRIDVGRIVWRSRYVLAMLVVFGILTIGMNQSRDVLVGMAQSFQKHTDPGWDCNAIAFLPPVLILPIFLPWIFGRVATKGSKGFKDWAQISLFVLLLIIFGVCALFWVPPRLSVNILYSIVSVWLFAYACWLWSRIPARLRPPEPPSSETCLLSRKPDGRDHFAKWWARLLGIVPFLLVIWLAGLASGDAAHAGAHRMSYGLFSFAFAAAVLAFVIQQLFKVNRDRDKDVRYYNVVKHDHDCAAQELKRPRYRFPFWLPHAPLTLPLLALLGFQGVRALDLGVGGQMPLALAAIALALTLWTCALGLLTQASLRQGMPWVMLLFVLMGLFGAFDLTDNQRVLTASYQHTGSGMLWRMWLIQFGLALAVIAAFFWAWRRVITAESERASKCKGGFWCKYWPDFVAYLGLAVFALLILRIGDSWLAPAGSNPAEMAQTRRIDLNVAIKNHIGDRLSGEHDETPKSVYFISAEGGGIRAAYWTALVLQRLESEWNDFPEGAFSISGVSGGSVGASVWQVCRFEANESTCIDRLGDANLLTPLLSSWLFEDVLATLLPTSADMPWVSLPSCAAPGCGVLSRGHWFERALEAAVPRIKQPLALANAKSPYLFLNSTRVEDGNRSIASRVRINPKQQEHQAPGQRGNEQFPSSVDQLIVLGEGLPLSTAAHNSARFTYINAIGSAGKWVDGHFDEGYHLADGGYFDNSGGHTTADIVRAYAWCLFGPDDPCGIDDTMLLDRARRKLVPRAIQIRNSVKPNRISEHTSLERCEPITGPSWREIDTFPNLIGPLKASFNSVGTGSNGRVAEAEICQAVRSWRLLRNALERQSGIKKVIDEHTRGDRPTADNGSTQASAAVLGSEGQSQATAPLVLNLDLVDEGVLYPLGWYLSPTAKCYMQQAARNAPTNYGTLGKMCNLGQRTEE
jgi:hypothetical protein